ncbi:DUF4340 domain-containing protein [Rhodoligotrophos defluvii]|uniref:DUF4340 domain-containing protein n=1 Tax=Rhodoligotrophos defluvii TaxID=2561934 RepID=UPI0010CA0A46|nr:DUF4340 domain-containing protein [Rhodoligotrophos defluvii]
MITPRVVVGLLVAAIVSLTAAAWSYSSNHQWTALDAGGEAMLPGLDQRLGDVAAIEVKDPAGAITLKRDGSVWRIANQDGYPADTQRVHALLITLAELKRIEPKTDRPDRYGVLGVGAPDKPDTEGAGTLVTLKAQDDATLAALIVGSLRAQRLGERGAPGVSGTYVRMPDQAQSWLVSQDVEVSSRLDRWVSTNVLGLRRDQIAEAVITPAGQPPMMLKRKGSAEGEQTFTIENLPANRQPKSSSGPMLAATDFAGLSFDAVRKLQDEGGSPASTVALATTDGMRLKLVLTKSGDESWLAVTQLAPGENKDASSALVRRTQGWQFRLSDAAAKPFFPSLNDLTEARPAPNPEATPPEAAPPSQPAPSQAE